MYLYNGGLRVPEAHNPINPTLNTAGGQCGETESVPMRVEYTLHHVNQQGSVPLARRIIVSDPTPTWHFASCGVNKITCFQHVYRTLKIKNQNCNTNLRITD